MIVMSKNRLHVYRITNICVDDNDVVTFINGKRVVLGTYEKPYEVLKEIERKQNLFIMPLYK